MGRGPPARQPGPAPSSLVCSTLLWSTPFYASLLWSALVCSILLQQDIFGVRKPTFQPLMERESALPEPEGSWLIYTDVPSPGPGLVYTQKALS